VGDLRTLDLFIKGFRDENLQQQSLAAIRNLDLSVGTPLFERFKCAEEEERCILVYIAGEINSPESRSIATAALNDLSPMVRALAAEAVGKSGMTELVPLLVNLLSDASPEARKRATNALVRLATVARESVVGSAIQLSESDSADFRLQAVKLFGACRETGHIILLSKDEDSLVRRESIIALGEMKNPETSGRLSMALADEEADVRLAAATALGWKGFCDESASLQLALEDSSQRVRVAALKSLGLRGDLSSFDSVAAFIGSGSGMLKIAALQSMVLIDPSKAVTFLELSMKDPDEEVATVAANLLDAVSERD
jgi:HEAT repeat protein